VRAEGARIGQGRPALGALALREGVEMTAVVAKATRLVEYIGNWSAGRGDSPEILEMLVTARCNSRCIMCNVWRLPQKRRDLAGADLDLATWCRVADEAAALGTKTVTLSGGEPLLRDDVFELIAHLKSLGLQVLVFTNGTVLRRPEKARAMVDVAPDLVMVSLDSTAPPFHDEVRGRAGAWEASTAGLRQLAAEKRSRGVDLPKVGLFSLVSRRNIPEVFGLEQMAEEFGAESVVFNPLNNKVPGALDDYLLRPEDVPEAAAHGVSMGPAGEPDYYKRHLCFSPYHQMTVDPFGNVFPCCFASDFQNLSSDLDGSFWGDKDRFIVGNVAESSLQDIWEGERLTAFRRSLHRVPPYKMCGQCGQAVHQPWSKLEPVFRVAAALSGPATEVP